MLKCPHIPRYVCISPWLLNHVMFVYLHSWCIPTMACVQEPTTQESAADHNWTALIANLPCWNVWYVVDPMQCQTSAMWPTGQLLTDIGLRLQGQALFTRSLHTPPTLKCQQHCHPNFCSTPVKPLIQLVNETSHSRDATDPPHFDTQATELTLTDPYPYLYPYLSIYLLTSLFTAHPWSGSLTTWSTSRPKTHFTWTIHTAFGGWALKKTVPFHIRPSSRDPQYNQGDGQADEWRGEGIGMVGGHPEWLVGLCVSPGT